MDFVQSCTDATSCSCSQHITEQPAGKAEPQPKAVPWCQQLLCVQGWMWVMPGD